MRVCLVAFGRAFRMHCAAWPMEFLPIRIFFPFLLSANLEFRLAKLHNRIITTGIIVIRRVGVSRAADGIRLACAFL